MLDRAPLTFVFNRSTGKIPAQFSNVRQEEIESDYKIGDDVVVNSEPGIYTLGKLHARSTQNTYSVAVGGNVLTGLSCKQIKSYCQSTVSKNAKFAAIIHEKNSAHLPSTFSDLYDLCFSALKSFSDSDFEAFGKYFLQFINRFNERPGRRIEDVASEDIRKISLTITPELRKRFAKTILACIELNMCTSYVSLLEALNVDEYSDDDKVLFSVFIQSLSVNGNIEMLKSALEAENIGSLIERFKDEEPMSNISSQTFGGFFESNNSYIQSSVRIPESVGLLLGNALQNMYSGRSLVVDKYSEKTSCSYWPLRGSYSDRGVAEVNYIYRRVLGAVESGCALLTTPDAVKCTLLTFTDLISAEKLSSVNMFSDRHKIEFFVQSLDFLGLKSLTDYCISNDSPDRFTNNPLYFSWMLKNAARMNDIKADSFAKSFLRSLKINDLKKLICSLLDKTDFSILNYPAFLNWVEERNEARGLLGLSADQTSKIIKVFRGSADKPGIAIVDEFDSILDPVRSELNFPIGIKQEYHIFQARSHLQIYVADVITTASALAVFGKFKFEDQENFHRNLTEEFSNLFYSQKGQRYGLGLIETISDGDANKFILTSPHMIVLRPDWYTNMLLPCMSNILVEWLENINNLLDLKTLICTWQANEPSRDVREMLSQFLGAPPMSTNAAELDKKFGASYYSDLKEAISTHISSEGIEMINLAQNILCKVLPHILSKTNCVHYGLLKVSMDGIYSFDTNQVEPPSRALLAVPFTGK